MAQFLLLLCNDINIKFLITPSLSALKNFSLTISGQRMKKTITYNFVAKGDILVAEGFLSFIKVFSL